MSKMSRDKGKRGEREAAALLRQFGFDEGARGVQYQGGPGSADVVGLPGHHIEVKRVESFQLEKAYEQAVAESAPGEIPLVLHRKNGGRWYAVLDAEHYLSKARSLANWERQHDEAMASMPDLTGVKWNE